MLPKKTIVEQLDSRIARFREEERPAILLYLRKRVLTSDGWQNDKNFLAILSEWVIPPS